METQTKIFKIVTVNRHKYFLLNYGIQLIENSRQKNITHKQCIVLSIFKVFSTKSVIEYTVKIIF